MTIRKKKRINTDFHTHILPFMDDGAADVEMSVKMLRMLSEQGIETVAATSHFDIRRETVSDFLTRRDESYKKLCALSDAESLPKIVLGAEVLCTEGFSRTDLSPLCYENTNYLLVEFPRIPYREWIYAELEVIAYKQKLVPIIAHIDRYMEWYSDRDIKTLLSFDEALFQINNNAFLKNKVNRKVCDIISRGYPVLVGSDAHDVEKRRPNFDLLNKELSKLKYRGKVLPLLENSTSKVELT